MYSVLEKFNNWFGCDSAVFLLPALKWLKKKVSQECKLTVGSFTKQLLEMKKKNGGGEIPLNIFF